MIITLNIVSKFANFKLSKSLEAYFKYTFSRQILVFAIAWMGTRDIYVALGLTAVFTILSEHLFNENSSLCVIPERHRTMNKIMTQIDNGTVTPEQLKQAEIIIQKAKEASYKRAQKEAFTNFDLHKI